MVDSLGCGTIYKDSKKPVIRLVVVKYKDINEKIISLFNKYPLQGSKRLDYTDFCKVVELMKNKAHLTEEGLAKIREIRRRMNTGRDQC